MLERRKSPPRMRRQSRMEIWGLAGCVGGVLERRPSSASGSFLGALCRERRLGVGVGGGVFIGGVQPFEISGLGDGGWD